MPRSVDNLYEKDFFDRQVPGALRSARIIVPIVLDLVAVESVIDIGCGYGAWLLVFQEHGVREIQGVDGLYVDSSKLLIDPLHFVGTDLTRPLIAGRCYDLAVCLEVVEHLPTRSGFSLIDTLTAAAPVVLFSAAIPGQGGVGHINEQWPCYWERLFAERGYVRLDPIRSRILNDSRIDWWYRQNIVLYVSKEAVARSKRLQEEETLARIRLEILHGAIVDRFTSLKGILREVPSAARRAIQRRLYR